MIEAFPWLENLTIWETRGNAPGFEYMWSCVDHVEGRLFSRQTKKNAPNLEICDLVRTMLRKDYFLDKLGRIPMFGDVDGAAENKGGCPKFWHESEVFVSRVLTLLHSYWRLTRLSSMSLFFCSSFFDTLILRNKSIISFLETSRILTQVWFMGFKKQEAHFFERPKLASKGLHLLGVDNKK